MASPMRIRDKHSAFLDAKLAQLNADLVASGRIEINRTDLVHFLLEEGLLRVRIDPSRGLTIAD